MKLRSIYLTIIGFMMAVSCFVNVANAGLITDEVTVSISQFGYPTVGTTIVTSDDSDAFYLTQHSGISFYINPFDTGLDVTLAVCPFMYCQGIGIVGDSDFFVELSDLNWQAGSTEIIGVSVVENLNTFVGSSSFTNGSARVSFTGDSNWRIGETLSIHLNTQQVPEPSTLAIFALSMIGLASRRAKK